MEVAWAPELLLSHVLRSQCYKGHTHTHTHSVFSDTHTQAITELSNELFQTQQPFV